MPRHWHPVKFASIKVINVSYDGKMDSSVKHWNNTKGATIVFPKVNDKDIIRYLSYNGI